MKRKSLLLLLPSLLLTGCNKEPTPNSPKDDIEHLYALKCRTVAHRGYIADGAVENTEKAFIDAGKRNFYAIETDIYPTKDGVYICNHDNNIPGQTRQISEMTYEEILEIDLSRTGDEIVRICTFKRYIEICREYKKTMYLELKTTPSLNSLEYILNMIDEMGMADHCNVISFGMQNIHNVAKLNKAFGWHFTTDFLTSSIGTLYDALENGVNVSCYYPLASKELVEAYHAKGLTVGIWTLNDSKLVDRFLEMGIKTITTDFMECDPMYLSEF